MENVELRLIAKIVDKGDFRTVIKAKMTPDMFATTEARIMFEDIWRHYHSPKHPGAVPTNRLMKNRFPAFLEFKHTKETLDQLCEEIRQNALVRKIQEVVKGVPKDIKNPYNVLEKLRSGVSSIQSMTSSSRDILLRDYAEDIVREYNLVKKHTGIMGVPWPWEELNVETNGMLPEELIIIYGRLKSMKTFVGCYIAASVYRDSLRRVLFYSAEMSPPQIIKRLAAAYCQIDYKAMKHGKLSEGQERDLFDAMGQISSDEDHALSRTGRRPSLLVTSDKDDIKGIGGVSHIQAKAEEFDPDLIIVDSYYRMRDDRSGRNDYDWKVQAAIAQDMKHMAQRLKIPVIGIGQANRSSKEQEDAEGMEDASYTDATGQEADLAIRIVMGVKDVDGVPLKAIIAAAREVEPKGFHLKVIPFTKFKFECFMEELPERVAVSKGKATKKVNKTEVRTLKEKTMDETALAATRDRIRNG
jgi:replicative DNA helicase